MNFRRQHRFVRFSVASLLLLAGVLTTPLLAYGAMDVTTFDVDMTADSAEAGHRACTPVPNDCSLRGALFRAWAISGPDTVVMPAGTYTLTIPTASGDLALTGDLDIHDDVTVIGLNGDRNSTRIVAANNDRVFEVWPGASLTLRFVLVTSLSHGGIYVDQDGRAQLDSVAVEDNKAYGVTVALGSLSATNCRFYLNGNHGLYVSNGSGLIEISDSFIGYNGGSGIQNDGGRLVVTNSTIVKNGSYGLYNYVNSATVTASMIGANGRAIINLSGGTVTLSNTVVSGNGQFDPFLPAAIHNDYGSTLKVIGGEISHNRSLRGGGINNHGSLEVTGAVIKSNTAVEAGGGIYIMTGTWTIVDSTISQNVVNGQNGEGGGVWNNGEVSGRIERSTISGNTAGGYGGGVHHGRLYSGGGGTLTMVNSTISGNTAGIDGGGLYAVNGARYDLTNTTVAYNAARYGGALGVFSAPAAWARNTIFARSTAESDCSPSGAVTSLDYNLFGDGSCGISPQPGDLRNVDPLLEPLTQNSGERTATHALKTGSPALDRIPPSACPATDQRGMVRPSPAGGHCDIGAFELSQTAPPPPPPPPPITSSITFKATFGDINTIPDGSQDHYQTYNAPAALVTWAQHSPSGGGSPLPPDLSSSDAYSLAVQVANRKFPFVLSGYPRFNPDRVQRAMLRVDLGWPVVGSPGSDTLRFWDEHNTTGVYTSALNHGLRVNDLLNKRHPLPGCVYNQANKNCAEPQWVSLEINLLDGSVRATQLSESGAPVQEYGVICPSADICPAWGAQAYNADRGGPRDVLRSAADGNLFGLLEDDSYLSYLSLEVEAEPAAPLPLPPLLASFSSNEHPGGALGVSWLGATSTDSYRVVGDQLDVGAGGPVYWSPQAFGPGQQASIQFVKVDQANVRQSLLLKVQGDDWTAGAIAVSYDPAALKINVETHTPGTGAGWMAVKAFDVAVRDGDRLSATASADGAVRVSVNAVDIGSAFTGDFFIGKGGRVGLWFVQAEEAVLDDFGVATTEASGPVHHVFLPHVLK